MNQENKGLARELERTQKTLRGKIIKNIYTGTSSGDSQQQAAKFRKNHTKYKRRNIYSYRFE